MLFMRQNMVTAKQLRQPPGHLTLLGWLCSSPESRRAERMPQYHSKYIYEVWDNKTSNEKISKPYYIKQCDTRSLALKVKLIRLREEHNGFKFIQWIKYLIKG
jgi:hypothetical protein